jgi:hypothetical protein
MRKLITLFLLVFALALGASAMAQAIGDPPTPSTLGVWGEMHSYDVTEMGAIQSAASGGFINFVGLTAIEVPLGVEAELPADAGAIASTPQEGEPAEASIYIGVMLLAIIGLLLTGLRRSAFTIKRQARTLLFQPPQTT